MAWENSSRRSRLPDDWEKIRSSVLRRDHRQCQVRDDNGRLCLDYANEVDHIVAGDNHSAANLQAICRWHHKAKSSSEGDSAAARARREINSRFRRTEGHPGLL